MPVMPIGAEYIYNLFADNVDDLARYVNLFYDGSGDLVCYSFFAAAMATSLEASAGMVTTPLALPLT